MAVSAPRSQAARRTQATRRAAFDAALEKRDFTLCRQLARPPWPVDCTPLERETWQEHARDLREYFNRQRLLGL